MTWHSKTVNEVLDRLKTDSKKGISEEEAKNRINTYGENKLETKKRKGIIVKFLSQFNDFMVIILIIAAVVSFIVSIMQGDNDFIDPIIIIIIVVLNAVIGLIQESKAEKALEALKNLSAPTAKVIRGGINKTINTKQLVPGDLITLSSGDFVPADVRIITSVNLKAEESALTGESIATEKNADCIMPEKTSISERENMLFSGSSISYGRCTAVVVETGMNTEVGKIAKMIIVEDNTQTPLQLKLGEMGKILGVAALAICLFIFVIGLIRKIPMFEMFMTSVSLAVAAIPEGLPAIVTIMLAIGVEKMAKHNAVVRRLPAVETLGSANVICSDKTGTLTQNKMKVNEIYSSNKIKTIKTACLCNDCITDGTKITGEPTEVAIINCGLEYGIYKNEIDRKAKRINEIPFDSKRKMMSTIHKTDDGIFVAVKGAPDILINKCRYICENNSKVELTEKRKREILNQNNSMAKKALRVLAVAYKELSTTPKFIKSDYIEKELTFCGLIGMMDPPREEVKDAVKICKAAGIKTVMITGDHLITAAAIAKKIGIMNDEDKALTGAELEEIRQTELEKNIYSYSVFARVSPEHKVRIVKAFKSRGAVVAMTGDGINDAPALKSADIGCAMGISGTDVAKGAADIVLTDDNFATIVEAVKEGRGIYSNIKKAIHFLLSSNIGEIITILAAMLIGFATPLAAIHLLWVNLVTDSLPAIALGLDPISKDTMKRKPYNNKKNLFNNELWFRIVLEGMMIGMLALIGFGIGCAFFDEKDSIAIGRTISFSVLSISQLVHAFNMRTEKSIFSINIFENKYLIGALILGIIFQVSVIEIPFLSQIFKVVPLTPVHWLVVLVLCIMPIIIVETEKLVWAEKE